MALNADSEAGGRTPFKNCRWIGKDRDGFGDIRSGFGDIRRESLRLIALGESRTQNLRLKVNRN